MGLFKKRSKKLGVNKSLSFLLLINPYIDHQQLIDDLKAKYNIQVNDYKVEDDTVSFRVNNLQVVYLVSRNPIPDNEAVTAANYNFYNTNEAVDIAKNHNAHVILIIEGDATPLEVNLLYIKLVICFFKQGTVLGLYSVPTVQTAREIEKYEKILEEGDIPIEAFVYLGFTRNDNLVDLFSVGLEKFNKKEIEIIGSKKDIEDVYGFLYNCCHYVISNDVTLKANETIGNTEEEKLKISISKGLYNENNTIKINYYTNNHK